MFTSNLYQPLLFSDRLDNSDQIESYMHNILWYDSTTGPDKEFSTTELPHLPFFEDDAEAANMTVQSGVTVLLQCRVNDLLDKTVSLVFFFFLQISSFFYNANIIVSQPLYCQLNFISVFYDSLYLWGELLYKNSVLILFRTNVIETLRESRVEDKLSEYETRNFSIASNINIVKTTRKGTT